MHFQRLCSGGSVAHHRHLDEETVFRREALPMGTNLHSSALNFPCGTRMETGRIRFSYPLNSDTAPSKRKKSTHPKFALLGFNTLDLQTQHLKMLGSPLSTSITAEPSKPLNHQKKKKKKKTYLNDLNALNRLISRYWASTSLPPNPVALFSALDHRSHDQG